uniref:Uncharacterized protein n=1 Tax=Oryza barthii TaxID=65489 RepID=A0A0D3EMH8_9ORYZ
MLGRPASPPAAAVRVGSGRWRRRGGGSGGSGNCVARLRYVSFVTAGCPIEIFYHITDLCSVTGVLPDRDEACRPLQMAKPVLMCKRGAGDDDGIVDHVIDVSIAKHLLSPLHAVVVLHMDSDPHPRQYPHRQTSEFWRMIISAGHLAPAEIINLLSSKPYPPNKINNQINDPPLKKNHDHANDPTIRWEHVIPRISN